MIDQELFTVAAQIAQEKLGISVHALGRTTIESALTTRLRIRKISTKQYILLVQADNVERDEFCQLLLISESWFGREITPLKEALHLQRKKKEYVSILSVPCARGEEAITSLYCALKAGFLLNTIFVEGYDASEEAIKTAHSFAFTPFSFRSTESGFENEFFDKQGALSFLKNDYRDSLQISCANVFDSKWTTRFQSYDIILCRNLLIYLSVEKQKELVLKLTKLLSEDGMLLVAAAEAPILSTMGFAHPSSSPLIFSKKVLKTKQRSVKNYTVASLPKSSRVISRVVEKTCKRADSSSQIASRIRMLADSGKFEEAFTLALHELERTPQDAELHFLLGVISSSCGKVQEAHTWITKALEICPSHEDAELYLQILTHEVVV